MKHILASLMAPLWGLLLLTSTARAGVGDLFVGGDDGILYRGNAAQGQLLPFMDLWHPIRQMVQGGDDLFVAVEGGLVLKVDIPAVVQTYAYSAASDVTAMALDASQVFAGNAAGVVERYNRQTGALEGTLTFAGPIVGLGATANALFVAILAGDVLRVDLADDSVQPWTQVGVDLNEMELGQAFAYSATTDGRIARINAQTPEAPSFFPGDPFTIAAVEYFDGAELLITDGQAHLLRIDSITGAELRDLGPLPVGTRAMVVDSSHVGTPGSAYCDAASAGCPCGNETAAGCANSTGEAASLSGTGSFSVSADDSYLAVRRLPAQQLAAFFMGPAQGELPFGDGRLCVAGGSSGLFRFPPASSGDSGYASLGLGIVAHGQEHFGLLGQITVGSTWNFQAWYRDPAGPCGSGFNTSNAYSIRFER